MALQNIGASNRDDAFYRYKMPKMITKIEGRGNGIRTNVVNMVDIAKALARPASYTTKYFGCELGAQSKFDEKTGTCTVNGSHDTKTLADYLEKFIKKYVQCYGCGNPETEIVITKTQMITLKCAACGFISAVDMRDKLTTFILKNPPEQKKGSKDKKAMRRAEKERLKEGEAADEELRKLKKEGKKKGASANLKDASSKTSSKKKNTGSDEDHSPTLSLADENDEADGDEDDDVQWQADTSMEAAQKRVQEQLSAVTANLVMPSTGSEEKKAPNKSPERHVKSDVKEQGNGVILGAHGKLVQDIRKYLEKGSSATQLNSFLGSLSGSPQEVVNALLEALFQNVGKGFAKIAAKKKNDLAVAAQYAGSEMILLHGIESFCGKASTEAVKEVALVLKELYDQDVLEEEFIIQWYEQGSVGGSKNSQIWKSVKPFIEWLQNAESESEEERSRL